MTTFICQKRRESISGKTGFQKSIDLMIAESVIYDITIKASNRTGGFEIEKPADMTSRRNILKMIGGLPVVVGLPLIGCGSPRQSKPFPPETEAEIFYASGADPAGNIRRLVESLGGMENLIGPDDVVVLKPNSQWWHQGMTNTDAMAEFIRMIIEQPGFAGEVIIADNHQDTNKNSRGWTTEKRNGRFNYNELIRYFNVSGHANVTKYHWHPAGPNPEPLQFAGSGNRIRRHVSEGDGYIWPENEELAYVCPYGNRTILAYPVFTSAYSGLTIDLKDGVYAGGEYTGQPLKLINFAALNHHGPYAGVTASVKNFMGVVDMSCGYPAPYPEGTYNTHHIGATPTFKWLARYRSTLKDLPFFSEIYEHPRVFHFRYTGGVLGRFMKKIRRADLNIITAVRVGWGSRIAPRMASSAEAIIASTDPVALDFWAASNILTAAALEAGADDYYVRLNDPRREDNVFRYFLEECRRELGGTINPDMIKVTRV